VWREDEIVLLKTLIEQVEQTLENARLFEATEKRAMREQMTRSITNSIRSAVTVDDAIRQAVTSLAEVLDAEEIAAQLQVVEVQQNEEGVGDD
jgi:GAF domain-containing protein